MSGTKPSSTVPAGAKRLRVLRAVAEGALDEGFLAGCLNKGVSKYEEECLGGGQDDLTVGDEVMVDGVNVSGGTVSRTVSGTSTASSNGNKSNGMCRVLSQGSQAAVPLFLMPRTILELDTSSKSQQWLCLCQPFPVENSPDDNIMVFVDLE
jgi:hypothetical protein